MCVYTLQLERRSWGEGDLRKGGLSRRESAGGDSIQEDSHDNDIIKSITLYANLKVLKQFLKAYIFKRLWDSRGGANIY